MATAAIDAGAALQTPDGATIADSAATCVGTFNAFLTGNVLPADGGDAESSAWAEEQMARFSIWAANLGVFARGHASADYRLRDSDEVCSLILQLLDALRENLLCTVTSSVVQDEEETGNSNSGSDASEGHSPALSTSSFTFSSLSSNKASVEDAIPTSVLEARTEVEDAICRLNRLSASIRKSGAQFRDAKAVAFVDEDDQGNNWTDFYAHLSVLVIKQKFPDACEELQKRLANSLARRRNQLAYRRRHQRKLTRRSTDERPLLGAFHQDRSRPIEATIPTRPEIKRQFLSNTSASLFDPKRFINRPQSTTSKAPSTAMLGTPSQVAILNFPAEPKLDRSGFFECPYCFIICPAKEARGTYWKHHVMKDLAPYVCLFGNCKNPQEYFQTFSDWITHSQNEHVPLHWDCMAPIHEPVSFDDQDLYMEHMKLAHPGTFANSQLPALAQLSARAESRLFTICPLCNNLPEDLVDKGSGLEVRENQGALQKHIAQHLQSLALVSLSWLDDSKSDASSKRDSDLVMEDDGESLKFDDPPDEQTVPSSHLDPDWKGKVPVADDIGVDQSWESSRTSEEAALEWWFILNPSTDLNPDHTKDKTLETFVAAFLKSTATESTSQRGIFSSLFPQNPNMIQRQAHQVPHGDAYSVADGDNRNRGAQVGNVAAHAAEHKQEKGTKVDKEELARIVAEENESKGKLPRYPGLERWHLIEKMGDGAFSNVYRARDLDGTAGEVAIKVVRKFEMNSQQRANILKEVQIMRQLDHPNIVKLVDFSESRQYYYIILELAPGGELFHQIVRLTYFSEDLSRHVITQVADALEYLHETCGVVHRDIKLENLLFSPIPVIPTKHPKPKAPEDEDKVDEGEFIKGVGAGGIGKIKIADFGLSKVVWDNQTMTPCGTVGYTAPEIVKDERYSKSVDMWALGCVLYTLLCGFPPFYDESIQVLTEKVARGQYTFLSPWWDDISKPAQDLVSHLLTVDPAKRYTIKQFLAHPWIKGTEEPTYAALDAPPLATPAVERQKQLGGTLKVFDPTLLESPGAGKRMDFRSPGAVNLREVFDVGYAVHRQEEEAKRRKNFKQGFRGAAAANGLNPIDDDDFLEEDEDEEDSAIPSKVPKARDADVHQVEQSLRNTNLNAAAAARVPQQKGYGQHSPAVTAAAKQQVRNRKGAFELNLEGATLLGRRH